MHEARGVETGDDFGTGLFMVGDAVPAHEARYCLFVDGEGAAETATLVGAREVDEFYASQLAEKKFCFVKRLHHELRGTTDAQLAQTVAAHVQSNFAGKVTVDFGDVGDIHEVFTELEGGGAKMVEAFPALQPLGVVVAHHGNAASRWGDHLIVLAEDLEKSF